MPRRATPISLIYAERRELEAILTGKRGGPWAVVSMLVITWLPMQIVQITIEGSDNPTVTIGDVGQVQVQRVRDTAGRPTQVLHAPALGVFQADSVDLARSDGTRWSDPDMRLWEGGGSGIVGAFRWSA